ncbi:dirigent protein 22-like [Malania oleifera]|uniref:dirigent protein 22-like n=1 Tax=Malania oleifera TaxID=397392 RepID=UPI0025AE718B|nr:dirigent protein 22-like [Malania oleifera]
MTAGTHHLPKPNPTIVLFLTLFFFFISTQFAAGAGQPRHHLHVRREKLSHFHFYFHDIVSGNHPTVVRVVAAPATNGSATGFGMVTMMDDPLTAGPERGSRLVGRAQGMYASAAQAEVGLLMVVNYVFEEGKYKGSSVSVVGRNAVFSEVREMPIVGGSGLFRFARGYVQAKTHSFDVASGDAVVEYDAYVYHY